MLRLHGVLTQRYGHAVILPLGLGTYASWQVYLALTLTMSIVYQHRHKPLSVRYEEKVKGRKETKSDSEDMTQERTTRSTLYLLEAPIYPSGMPNCDHSIN
jgi:hypothetical protein